MKAVGQLPNIGEKIAKELESVGIKTEADLARIGSVEALLRINAHGMDVPGCLNKLYALEGAILGVRWHHLDDTLKKRLKETYRTKQKNCDCEQRST